MLNPQACFDKHLLRLGSELRELWRRRWTRVPLDEPIQRGWRRLHVLTAEAERRADKDVLLALLEVIGSVQIRWSPDFRDRRGRGRRRRYIEIEQPLHELSAGEWARRRLPEEWKPYFRHERHYSLRAWHDILTFASPHLFELKVEPNWITETFICDPAIEERMAEIEGWLCHHGAMYRLERLRGHSRYLAKFPRQHYFDKIAQRELRAAMRNPAEVDPAASKWRSRLSFHRIILPSPSLLFPGVAQCRGNELRPRPVQVRVLPPGPYP